MQAISSTTSAMPSQAMPAMQGAAAPQAPANAGATGFVHAQSSTQTASVDATLNGQELLQFMIAMMVLEALLGNDKESEDNPIAALLLASMLQPSNPLSGLGGGHSTIQVEESTTIAYGQQAVQNGAYADPTMNASATGSTLSATG